ncbi:Ku protein [Rhizobium sp. Leaf384]|uniref:non-homologous end joining protein Ku n=1 Tax=unclassified Rhizobium TaxID=2613769 RepID=UPI0007135626|nr:MULTISPECIES: Ku protein [unclassified Rhizobium]KQR69285.1 Ku protein [Rhizobium sp. Leaf341]KQS77060.1 Ku protein [Rhizobium sp. Leaf384]KQS78331.1 Ku protein [Rhizobium sp. Leaf383]
MARRASWKGQLKIRDLNCAVGLYTAISSSEKISFNIINRKTGHRVERQFVDSETGKPVERDDQIKGYPLDNGDYIAIEGDDLAALMPDSDKVLNVTRFIALEDVDTLYFDRPYHLAPVEDHDAETLSLLARSMRDENVAAIAEAILFRRNRTVLIRPQDDTLTATTLNFDYEVRSAKTAFKSIPDIAFDEEMLDLAGHIIGTKAGHFDPESYSDRYNDALAELVKAKIEGRTIEKKAPPKHDNVVDLKEALRQSLAGSNAKPGAKAKGSHTRDKKAS